MTPPELNNQIEVGNTMEDKEKSLIDSLRLDAFNADPKKENIDEFKDILKGTNIKVIIWVDTKGKETIAEKTLLDIANDFATYVEKWAWWTLKIWETNKANTPQWIQYIIDNPKNNDLAYLIQKVSALIEYQTAKAYTDKELDAVDVSIDRTFGNQTKRALAGLKAWIENDKDYKTIAQWEKYTGKYLDKKFIDWVISTQNTDEEKNDAISKYNLQYKESQILPAEWYVRIDPNSNNYAVIKSGTKQEEVTPQNSWKLDKYGNTVMIITDINQLPKDWEGNYKRNISEKKMYQITVNKIVYDFWSNWRAKSEADKQMKSSEEIVIAINNQKEKKEDSEEIWNREEIKKQLKWLDNDETLINQIISKNYTYDSLEYNNMYITINKWIIAIYLDKKDFEAADKLGRNEKNKEDINKWNTLRENKIKELLDSIDDTTITDNNKKIGLKSVPWVFFKNTQELKSFIRWRNALIEKFAYTSSMEEPFKMSDKWNIYHEDKNGEKKYLEDYIWNKYADIKYIEDYKWDSEDYKAEVKEIVAYLNNMKCRDSKISIEWMTRPY